MRDDCVDASINISESESYEHNYTETDFEKLVASFRELTIIRECNNFVVILISDLTIASAQLSEHVHSNGDLSIEPHSKIDYIATDLNSDLKVEPKVREAQLAQYKYMLVVGEEEANTGQHNETEAKKKLTFFSRRVLAPARGAIIKILQWIFRRHHADLEDDIVVGGSDSGDRPPLEECANPNSVKFRNLPLHDFPREGVGVGGNEVVRRELDFARATELDGKLPASPVHGISQDGGGGKKTGG
ncbi:hypothetical protein VIGAN_01153200 [Vigna angularis var. angularis]|uniref:Uncharacterized protein n=1 Tax=Vigna angularis var. angularis TaxID=157739 RepID=A0A0S3R029_PHAAN|nr:hypothetical protein VIGAN_01153200 [Vigna angularis var. angularis]